MPELPEVETTCQAIAPVLTHQTIKAIKIYQPKLRWRVPERLKRVCPVKVLNVQRRAKYLLISTQSGTVIIHLGMSGHLRILPKTSIPQKHDHVDLILSKEIIRYTDPRRFGAILWTEMTPDQHPLLTKLGPEPLVQAFNYRYLYRLLQNRIKPIKHCLMESQIVVGVGNIYASEALFRSQIRPTRNANTLTLQECQQLVKAIKQVLREAIQKGGTTLKDFRSPLNQKGYFSVKLDVYGRTGKPCNRCQQPIKRIKVQQRSSFYCANCQI